MRVDVVIIGAGQAGLSLSRFLAQQQVDHVVLEREQIGASWLGQRWDSFCLVTPNWATRLYGESYQGDDPHGFMGRDDLVHMLRTYAGRTKADVISGCDVNSVVKSTERWLVTTRCEKRFEAKIVVVATATHQHAKYPPLARQFADVEQLHASEYRNVVPFHGKKVLVVGSGQSGVQIAQELNRSGCEVILATSRVGKVPRRYRGLDVIDWQARLGYLDRHADALESPAHRFRPDPQLSGANGGQSIDLRDFRHQGIQLAGRLEQRCDNEVLFGDDLNVNLRFADAVQDGFERDVDELIMRRPHSLADVDIEPRQSKPNLNKSFIDPIRAESLHGTGIQSIIWATGFSYDFSWIEAPEVFDYRGYPIQREGVSAAPGLHFMGLNYVERRRSGILYGAGVEARELGQVIAQVLGKQLALGDKKQLASPGIADDGSY